MKYLINGEFKALRKGEFVKANEDAGEFIFDTENPQQSNATLLEVFEANGLKVKNKKAPKAELVTNLFSELETLKLDEVNKMGQTEAVTKIVMDGHTAGKSDDEIKVEIVMSGVSFKDAGKLFDRIMEEKGLRMSNAKRKEAANAILAEANFEPTEWQHVVEMRQRLEKEIADTNEKQAMGAIRAYLKVEAIELPKKVREKKVGFRQGLLDWMVANPTATKEELGAHMESVKEGIDEKVVNRYAEILTHAQAVAAATIAAQSESAEAA